MIKKMIRILKKSSPHKLIVHQKTRIKGVVQHFGNMSADCKDNLRESLRSEQGGICAYCNQKLGKKTKIEHHCEQTICNGRKGKPDKRIDYSNMFLVCEGNPGKDQHCDSKKSEFTVRTGLPMELNPLIKEHTDSISYTKGGIIKSTNRGHSRELNTLLNLNQKILVKLRKRKIIGILKLVNYSKQTPNYNKLLAFVQDDIRSLNYSSNFPGISKFYYNKYK